MYKTSREQKDELVKRILFLLVVVGVLLFIGTLAYWLLEEWSLLDSLYFATLTLTTKGYSNLYPTNPWSTGFSVVYLLVGVALLLYTVSTLVGFYIGFYQSRVEEKFANTVKKIQKAREHKQHWVTIKKR